MSDQEIEDLIIRCIEKCLKLPGCYYSLLFDAPDKEYGFNVSWSSTTRGWVVIDNIDPLSCMLLIDNPERNSIYDDNEIISTVAVHIDKHANWVRSFQRGWYGETNNSASITGYLLGRKLRLKYLHEEEIQ